MKNVCAKKHYKSENEAKTRAEETGLKYYLCPVCMTFHLTSKKIDMYKKEKGRFKAVSSFLSKYDEKDHQAKDYVQQFNIKQ
jgi:hypothetical protein